MPAVPTLADPLPADLARWANPRSLKVRRSADAFLNRALILTKGRKAWQAGEMSEDERARVGRALVVYMRDEARAVAELFVSGDLTRAQWRDRMAEITGPGAVATTWALQGGRRLNRDDARAIEDVLARQFAYLNRFVGQVEAGTVKLDGRIVSRSLLYATSAWSSAQAAARSLARRTWTLERNVLGPADHCRGCLAASAQGWVAIGTLVPVGERDCRVNCRCRYEFKGRQKAKRGIVRRVFDRLRGRAPAQADPDARSSPNLTPPGPPSLPPEPPPVPVDPGWIPPVDPAGRAQWYDRRRAWLESQGDDAGVRELGDWRLKAEENPRLIPPGPIKDRIALYRQRSGDETLRAIQSAADLSPRIRERLDKARTGYEAAFQESQGGDGPSVVRAMKARKEFDLAEKAAERWRKSTAKRAHDRIKVPAGERVDFRAELAESRTYAPEGKVLDSATTAPATFRTIESARDWIVDRFRAANAPPISARVGLIAKGDDKRPYATIDAEIVALVRGTKGQVAVHEFGHILEKKANLRQLANEFLSARIGNETPQRMADLFPGYGYADHEVGREDEFAKAFTAAYGFRSGRNRAFYTGKVYEGGETEVLSLGLEEMYAHPVEFATGDPEYAAFILGIMDGSIR